MSFRGFFGTEYEQRASAANTDEQLVHAIEVVGGGEIDDETSGAYRLWADGGQLDDILAAIPVCGEDEGTVLLWGDEPFCVMRAGAWALLP